MPMIDTADIVAARYNISREAQDAYALESQRRTAAAQQAGRFDAEIVPISTTHERRSTRTPRRSLASRRDADEDEGPRPDTTAGRARRAQAGARKARQITAGNASQLSDGASACVVWTRSSPRQRGLQPLGTFRGFAVAGCEPDEMGIGPVFAVPRAARAPRTCNVDDIDLWELNEAFAVQVLYCRDRLGIIRKKLNVDWRRHRHRAIPMA